MQQELQAGLVTPVQIFYYEQDGMLPCLLHQEVRQHGKKTTLLTLRIKRGQLRKQGDLASSLFGLLYKQAKSSEFRGSADDLRAQERSIDRAFHRISSLSAFASVHSACFTESFHRVLLHVLPFPGSPGS